MKCQYCGQHEAENHFLINWMGMEYNVHLCDTCKDHLTRQYMQSMHRQLNGGQMFPGIFPGVDPKRRALGAHPFPSDAEDRFKRRRVLNMLRAQLQDAIRAEEYEDAAKLRDALHKAEEELGRIEEGVNH